MYALFSIFMLALSNGHCLHYILSVFTWRMTVLVWNIQVEVIGVFVGLIQVLLISDAVPG